jgi:hypothetical protein
METIMPLPSRLLLLPLLAACAGMAGQKAETAQTAPVPAPEPAGESVACEPGAYDHLVGTPLAAVTLPAGLETRIIEPGMYVTMEYVAERLTIEVDEDGVITAARCG